ncbi:MAG TPA: hypothetical protein PLV61_01415 [Parvularculaceae bacterium]|nr:hypothetical protein [Amphiplicatus sp.]HPE29817.1 hypothetical protein [Parvularculaceae bacterium]
MTITIEEIPGLQPAAQELRGVLVQSLKSAIEVIDVAANNPGAFTANELSEFEKWASTLALTLRRARRKKKGVNNGG